MSILKTLLGNTLLVAIAVAQVLVVVSGCGFEKTRKVNNVTVNRESNSNVLGFALNDNRATRKFAGSFIVWKPETKRDDVAAILEATRSYNEAYTRSRAAIASLYQSDLRALEARRAELLKEKAELGQGSGGLALERRQSLLTFGASWFDDLTKRLSAEHGAAFDSAKASALFERYCDAKLWELATHPMLADGTFSERPVASPLCEGYFATKDYFAAPGCVSSESAPRNYFACAWSALRRTSFVTNGPLRDNLHGPLLEALGASPDFRRLVSGREAVVFCGVDALSVRKFRMLKVIQPEPCVIPGTSVVLDLNVPTDSRTDTPLTRMSPATVASLLDDQESRVSQDRLLALYPQALLLAASQGPRSGRELTHLERESDSFARRLSVLDKRGVKCGIQVEGFSASDVRFNLPFAVEGPMASGVSGNVGFVLRSAEGCVGMPDAALFPELLAQEGTSDKRLDDINRALTANSLGRDEVISRYCDLNNGRPESASRRAEIEARPAQTAIVDERSILATRDLNLALEPDVQGTSVVRAVLSFGPGTVPVVGCFAGFSGPQAGMSVPCSSGSQDPVSSIPGTFVFELEEGSIAASFSLNRGALAATGLAQRLGAFEATTFHAELFGNSFEGGVPYVSGAVRFDRDGVTVGRGVASYLIESDAAYQEANALVRECPRLGF